MERRHESELPTSGAGVCKSTCAAILAVLLATGASALPSPQLAAQRDASLADALDVLDRSVDSLENRSAVVRDVLSSAADALPAGAADAVRRDIRKLLARIPAADVDFRCGAEFIRMRARQALWSFRESLLGEEPAATEPAVCYAVPFVVDVTQLRAEGTVLDIFGFDFDTVPLQMVLVTGDDGYQDVTASLVQVSHYHLVLKVGPGGVSIPRKGQSLRLAWRHLIHYAIPVVQPATARLCASRVESVPGRTISYSPPSIAVDRLQARPASEARTTAFLDYANNKLEATICVTGTAGRQGGETIFGGCSVEFLYTTHADRIIDGVLGTLRPRSSAARGGLTATARVDQIKVVSTEDDGCIPPIAYVEAKRTNALNAETSRALDRQLERVDPAIRRLRPRFAP